MFHFTRYRSLCPMYSGSGIQILLWMGYPIRKSPDRSVLAAPRSLSQLIASFIAYRHQGIHHVLFVAFDIVHSEILCEQRIVSRRFRLFTDSALQNCNFLPYLQMSKNLRWDWALGERWILGSRTTKNFTDGSNCRVGRIKIVFESCNSVSRYGGPDWIRTSDPALIKRML